MTDRREPRPDFTLVSVDMSSDPSAWCLAGEYLLWPPLIHTVSLSDQWVTNVPSVRWNSGISACDSSPLMLSFTLVFGTGCRNVSSAWPPLRRMGGGACHVLFALRNGSVLFCGADSSSLCWRARPPWERSGQSWWQWWTRWNNHALLRSFVSHIPASNGNRLLPPTTGGNSSTGTQLQLMWVVTGDWWVLHQFYMSKSVH